MADVRGTPTISDKSHDVQRHFLGLTSLMSGGEHQDVGVSAAAVKDALDRFALWAGNLGAMRAPSASMSLDSRLSGAKDIHHYICQQLDELVEVTENLTDIIRGTAPNRDIGFQHGVGLNDDCVTDRDSQIPTPSQDEPLNEAHMIIQVISECITSLFRLGVLVRKSTHRDRFKRALQVSNDAFPSMFDVDYVRQKHPKIKKDWLVTRLGSGIAKRRQFIKYCRDHRTRLGVDDENQTLDPGTGTERLSSKATTFLPGKAQPVEVEDDIVSFASASTMTESLQSLKLPQLADQSKDNQPFECPICFTLQSFRTEKSWRIHAFRDLKAYVCTVGQGECDDEFFGDRDSWFEHELREHRARYNCSLCQLGPLASKDMHRHIQACHGPFPEDQLKMLQDAGREAVTKFQAHDCPFCDDWGHNLSRRANNNRTNSEGMPPDVVVSAGRFKRHVATHQEQLAIFALPRASEADGTPASGSLAARSYSRASSQTGSDVLQQGSVGSIGTANLDASTQPPNLAIEVGDAKVVDQYGANLAKFLEEFTEYDRDAGRFAIGSPQTPRRPPILDWENDDELANGPVAGPGLPDNNISEGGITRDNENNTSHVDSRTPPRSRSPGTPTEPASQGADSWATRGYEFTGPAELAPHPVPVLPSPRTWSQVASHSQLEPQRHNPVTDGAVFPPPSPRYDPQDYYVRGPPREISPVYANPERASELIRPSYPHHYPIRGRSRSRGEDKEKEEDRAPVVVIDANPPARTYAVSWGRSPPREEGRTSPIEGHANPTPIKLSKHADHMTRLEDEEGEGPVPPAARWTKIARRLVSPDALTKGLERFEVRDDFVTVLRVLSKEEIEAYSVATAQLRERRQAQNDLEEEEAASAPREDRDLDRDTDRDRGRYRDRVKNRVRERVVYEDWDVRTRRRNHSR